MEREITSSFFPAMETRKKLLMTPGWKCWEDHDAKIGRARVGPERDWSGHPGRRSLQPRRVSGVKHTPGVEGHSLSRILDRGSGDAKSTRADARGPLGPIRVCMQCYLATPPANGDVPFPPRFAAPRMMVVVKTAEAPGSPDQVHSRMRLKMGWDRISRLQRILRCSMRPRLRLPALDRRALGHSLQGRLLPVANLLFWSKTTFLEQGKCRSATLRVGRAVGIMSLSTVTAVCLEPPPVGSRGRIRSWRLEMLQDATNHEIGDMSRLGSVDWWSLVLRPTVWVSASGTLSLAELSGFLLVATGLIRGSLRFAAGPGIITIAVGGIPMFWLWLPGG